MKSEEVMIWGFLGLVILSFTIPFASKESQFERDNRKLAACRDAGMLAERDYFGEVRCALPPAAVKADTVKP